MTHVPIGEFSRQTGLSVRALRLYDEVGLLRPTLVDPRSGYRFYHPSQAMAARLIRLLRAVGMPLREVVQVLEAFDRGDRSAAHGEVDRHWEDLQSRHELARTLVSSLHYFIDREEPEVPVTIPSQTLAAALQQVVPAAGRDSERPDLMSVLFEGDRGGLRILASDSFRMAVLDLPGIGLLDDGRQVLIPATLLRELASGLPAHGEVGVNFADGNMVFDVGGGQQLAVETVDAAFPDYRTVLTADRGHKLSVRRHALIDVIERAATDLADGPAVAFALGEPIVVRAVADDGTVGPDHVVEASWAGPPLVVAVNPSFLADGIKNLSSDIVDLYVSDARRPIWIGSPGASEFAYLLMPVPVPEVARA